MSHDNEPTTRIREGTLMAFLNRDYFRVRLDDGQKIVAVMPEELFSVYDPNVRLTYANRHSVTIEMREPPAMPKIIRAHQSYMCGADFDASARLDLD